MLASLAMARRDRSTSGRRAITDLILTWLRTRPKSLLRDLSKRRFIIGSRASILCALSLTAGGCAILQPQVHSPGLVDARYGGKPAAKDGTGAIKPVYAGDLALAIDDANAQSKAYLDADGTYSTFRNSSALSAGVTGFSALLLGVLNHGSQDLRLGLAGAAAGILGLGGYFDNRPRQQVYLAGASAIECAVAAQRPLLITPDQQTELTASINGVQAAVQHFAVDLAKNQPRPPGTQLYGLAQGTTAQENATSVLSDALLFQTTLDSAGAALRGQVKKIVIAVDTEVVKTDPDLQSIQKVILSAGANIPKIESGGTTALTANSNTEVASAGGDWFDNDVVAMTSATNLLHAHLQATTAVKGVADATAACKVADVAGALKVDPDETSHNVTTVPTTVVYSVRGGMLPVSAGLSGDFPAGAFTVTPPTSGTTVQASVAVTKDAKGHQATLTISDGNGATHPIVIKVSASATDSATLTVTPPPAAQTPVAKQAKQKVTTPPKMPTTTAALTPQRLTMIRGVLNITLGAGSPTLTTDDETALKAYAATHNLTYDLALTSPLYKALVSTARAATLNLAPNSAEQALIQQNIVAPLRVACSLPVANPPTSTFDPALRGKIFDFEERAQKNLPADPVIDGRLDQTRLNLMLAAKCAPPT